MPELDLNYDLPWLQQAPDSNKPMSLAEAFQLRQHQQQIDAQKALLPLRQQEMRAQIANAALDHQIKQEQVDYALKAKAGNAELWQKISTTDWEDADSVSQLWSTVSRTGIADKSALNVIDSSLKISAAAKNKVEELSTKLRLAELKNEIKPKDTTLQDTIEKSVSDRNTELKSQGLPEMTDGETAAYRNKLRSQSSVLGGAQKRTQLFDSTGHLVFSEESGGGIPQGSTIGFQTKAQEDILANKKAFDAAQMLKGLDPSSVGVRGVIGSFVFDEMLSQIDPSLADNKRIDDRTKLIAARTKLFELVARNPRSTVAEREEAQRAMPSPKLNESFTNIQGKIHSLQETLKRWSYEDAVGQGLPPPYWTLPTAKAIKDLFTIKQTDLEKAVAEKKMTRAKASAQIQRELADAEEALAEQFNFTPSDYAPEKP